MAEKNEVTFEKNIELYNLLCEKHCSSIYSKRPNAVGEKLKRGKQKFIELDMEKQIYILLQILQLSQLINKGADLTGIGEAKATGTMKINKTISSKKQFELIHQSPAGLFEQTVDLLCV